MSAPLSDDFGDPIPVKVGAHARKYSFLRVTKEVRKRIQEESPDEIVSLVLHDGRHFITTLSSEPLVSGDAAKPDLEISSTLAMTIGLSTADWDKPMLLRPFKGRAVKLRQVWVQPCDPNDWEILELNAVRIQSSILDQLQVVEAGSECIIFNGNIPIYVKISKLVPYVAIGKLANMTELLVEPKERSEKTPELPSILSGKPDSSPQNKLASFLSSFLSSPSSENDGVDVLKETSERIFGSGEASPMCFRVAPIPEILCQKSSSIYTAVVYLTNVTFSGETLTKMTVVPKKDETDGKSEFRLKCKFVNGGGDFQRLPDKTVFLSKELMRTMHVSLGSQVRLQSCLLKEFEVNGRLPVFCRRTDVKGLIESVNASISDSFESYPLVFPNHTLVNFSQTGQEAFSIYLQEKSILVRSKHDLAKSIELKKSVFELTPTDAEEITEPVERTVLDVVENCFETALLSAVEPRLTFNMLLVGENGLGKTTALKDVAERSREFPAYFYSHFISCKKLIGKKPELISKELAQALVECNYRRRGMVLLDDLDCLCAQAQENEQNFSEETHYMALALSILKAMEDFRKAGIPVVATVTETERLHKFLVHGRGRHCFEMTFRLERPNSAQKKKVLVTQLATPSLKMIIQDIENIGSLTEGFTFRDINRLAKELELKNKAETLSSFESVQEVMTSFKPLSLWNARLQKPSNKSWSDIGGMAKVKRVITETILWPGKYPELFVQCPLRTRTGLLLYGAPGTGKTLIAGIAAKSGNLNFIAVKGPELLSKYIGASEAAVREVFQRAKSAQPCVLFFDEFDSLAPRRGHDSTGVTDRVVNQLLTQLDGVEGLQGQVFVLAATSRPDLIDPALLRPGRLDKKVFCPLPDESSRKDILAVLSRKMCLTAEATEKMELLANMTDGFTGADLQALLYTAQLNSVKQGLTLGGGKDTFEGSREDASLDETFDKTSVHEYFPLQGKWQKVQEYKDEGLNSTTSQKGKTFSPPIITWDHLFDAMKDTRPSVSQKELERFSSIYNQFDNGLKNKDTNAKKQKFMEHPRATLA